MSEEEMVRFSLSIYSEILVWVLMKLLLSGLNKKKFILDSEQSSEIRLV